MAETPSKNFFRKFEIFKYLWHVQLGKIVECYSTVTCKILHYRVCMNLLVQGDVDEILRITKRGSSTQTDHLNHNFLILLTFWNFPRLFSSVIKIYFIVKIAKNRQNVKIRMPPLWPLHHSSFYKWGLNADTALALSCHIHCFNSQMKTKVIFKLLFYLNLIRSN